MADRPEMVMVEWVDSNCEGGWQLAKDALREAGDNDLRCETAGYLVAETDRYVLVAATRSVDRGEREQLCDVIQIPCCSITGIRRLQLGRAR